MSIRMYNNYFMLLHFPTHNFMVKEVYLDREKGLLKASLIPYFPLSPVQLHAHSLFLSSEF